MVNFEFLNCLQDEEPLVVVDVLSLLDDATLTFAVTKAALVDSKHLEVKISEVLGKTAIGLGVATVAVDVEDDSFAGVLGRVAVCAQFDLATELGDWKIKNIDFFKLMVVGYVFHNLFR